MALSQAFCSDVLSLSGWLQSRWGWRLDVAWL